MKFFMLGLILLLIGGVLVFFYRNNSVPPLNQTSKPSTQSENMTSTNEQTISIVVENLDTPWGMAVLPDNSMLITERVGNVRIIDPQGNLSPNPLAVIASAVEIGEGGLLGIALHPNYSVNNFVYFYYTYSSSGDNTLNRVVRMSYKDGQLTNEEIIVDAIPGASNHNGGRIKFGPDGLLYIGTGDAQEPSLAQNTNSLAGKILRVTDTGQPAPGNPFNNRVYSYGHRNVQGLTWDDQGRLWATEHGRSGAQSGLDELNLIESGKNYGWPEIQGDENRTGMETAKLNSGSTTWAPAGVAFLNGSVYFGGLRGQSLYKVTLSDMTLTPQLAGEYGRIRDVIVGPDNMLYISTSNQDGRGNPDGNDDRILRINQSLLR